MKSYGGSWTNLVIQEDSAMDEHFGAASDTGSRGEMFQLSSSFTKFVQEPLWSGKNEIKFDNQQESRILSQDTSGKCPEK
jgi:hypothetical protein